MSRSPTKCRPSTGAGCPSTDGSCSRPRWRRRKPTTPHWRTTSGPGLGVRFAERPNPDPRLRPVREIVGVDPALNARWSTRRAAIETRRGELAAGFQRVHGRPLTTVESLKLAQQATLETRDAKHVPRSLTEQRHAWLAQASEVLGGPQAVKHMVHTALLVRCPMIMPQPRCGGGSAGISPQRSPPRPTPTTPSLRLGPHGWLNSSVRPNPTRSRPAGWWPALVAAVDHAVQRGWRLDDLLRTPVPGIGSVDQGQALLWRISLLANPMPTDEPGETPFSAAPPELAPNTEPPFVEIAFGARDDITTAPAATTDAVLSGPADRDWVEPDLAVAALGRGVAGPPEQSDADVNRMFTRAIAWQECPISRDRMIEINQLALAYFRSQFPSSWGHQYLADRFGQDLTDDLRFRPGQAPAGWTGLVSHLRSRGVTGEEMTAAGVATVASTGRLIDRFRDRVVFPIIHNGEVLGFVGRRHPDLTDAHRGGPKYLNTADTPLFHKGAQLFGAVEEHMTNGGVPVIVEGPMDAIAVTLAGGGRYIGVAPLGTSMTDEQASQLAGLGKHPIVATDADIAGRVAAERDFWILAAYHLDARYARLPECTDPADLLALNGPAALTAVLDHARPLGDELINERLTSLPPDQARHEAARIVAARPPECWDQGSSTISSRLNVPLPRCGRSCSPMSRSGTSIPGGPPPIPCTASTTSRNGWPKRLRSGRSSGGPPWPASSTRDSSDRATGPHWRS